MILKRVSKKHISNGNRELLRYVLGLMVVKYYSDVQTLNNIETCYLKFGLKWLHV